MNRTAFNRSGNEQSANRLVELCSRITLVGSTVVANINAFSDAPGGFLPYVEATGQPTPEDTGATFGTLDSNAAPATVGLLVMDGAFERFLDAVVLNITSGSMTAGVVTKAGASSTGVTLSGNLALIISCTTLDLDASVANHSFDVIVRAVRKAGQ